MPADVVMMMMKAIGQAVHCCPRCQAEVEHKQSEEMMWRSRTVCSYLAVTANIDIWETPQSCGQPLSEARMQATERHRTGGRTSFWT